MTEKNHSTPARVVQIGGSQVHRISYKGEPVVTFAMVDEIHQRVDGTAKRNFNENRDRFIEGEDFTELTSDEIRTMSREGVFPARSARGTILTRRGYLKLVKPMNDDRAWQVQGEMIDRYFAVEQAVAAVTSAASAALSREARLQFKQSFWLAQKLKLEGNQAILSANRATKVLTGVDMMGLLGVGAIAAPDNEALLAPTAIGQQLGGYKAHDVNSHLIAFGYQTMFRDHKGHPIYEPTDKGKAAGGVMQDTDKKHGNGVPVRQLRWASRIVDLLRADLAEAAA